MLEGYKNTAQPKPEWVEIDGQIGTAHKNRNGEWVNFRPGRCNYLDFHDKGGRAKWAPAKGMVAKDLTIDYPTIVAVDYEHAVVTCGNPTNPLVVGNPPPTIALTAAYVRREFSGFPIPADILAEWAATDAARAKKYVALTNRLAAEKDAADAAVREWAEALTGRERRWMTRWLTNGKAEQEILNAAYAALPNHNSSDVYRAMKELRKGFNS